jgi:hypothetical protein
MEEMSSGAGNWHLEMNDLQGHMKTIKVRMEIKSGGLGNCYGKRGCRPKCRLVLNEKQIAIPETPRL